MTWQGTSRRCRKGTFAVDELVRTDSTLERLGKLPAAFKVGGSVTAGNSSPYSDGAAAIALMSAERASALGLRPLARLASFAVTSVDPDVMGVGPIKAVPKALAETGITMSDIALIEFNEAFAAQAPAVARDLEMPMDKVNVNGGAIALGHPLGIAGAKLTAWLVHELGRRGGVRPGHDVYRRRDGRRGSVRGLPRLTARRTGAARRGIRDRDAGRRRSRARGSAPRSMATPRRARHPAAAGARAQPSRTLPAARVSARHALY